MIIPRTKCTQAVKVVLRLCNVMGRRKTLRLIITFLVELAIGLTPRHFVGGKGSIVRKEVLGHQVYVNLQDKGLSKELLTYRIHEPILSVLMLNEIRPGDVVVEVGANIGYYVLMECSSIKGSGKIIAIEPDSRSRKLLKMNVFGNGYAKYVEVVPYAIAAKRGTAKMLLSTAFNVSHVISPWFRKVVCASGDEKWVQAMTLDDLVLDESKIDVIRMDIEGYEFEAITGMIGTLTKFRPRLLVFELHPILNRSLMQSFFEIMDNLGYEIKWTMPRQLMKAMLNVPRPLLDETLEIVQGHATRPNLNTLIAEKTPIKIFAEKFCLSNEIHHVIFTPK